MFVVEPVAVIVVAVIAAAVELVVAVIFAELVFVHLPIPLHKNGFFSSNWNVPLSARQLS